MLTRSSASWRWCSMTLASDKIIETMARLRMACKAVSDYAGEDITPTGVQLTDLSENERLKLLEKASDDYWQWINRHRG